MLLRIFPHRGLPARGSFEDRVIQEMLLREQRRQIAVETYHGHLLAAGLGVRPELFALWTENLVDEITHNNYVAATIERKKRALAIFAERNSLPVMGLKRAKSYEIKGQQDLIPYTKEELAVLQEKIRKRTLDISMRHGLERPTRPKKA